MVSVLPFVYTPIRVGVVAAAGFSKVFSQSSDIPTPRSTPKNAPTAAPRATPRSTDATITPAGAPATPSMTPTMPKTAAPTTAPNAMPLPTRPLMYTSSRRSAGRRSCSLGSSISPGSSSTVISSPSVPWFSSASMAARASPGVPNSAVSEGRRRWFWAGMVIVDYLPRGRRPTYAPGSVSAELRAHQADERDHLARVATEVVGQADRAVGRDLALLGRLVAELEPRLEHHPQPRRADRVPEALQAAVRVHRDLAVEVERAGEDLLPRRAPLREPEILHDQQLGRREAVVHFRHSDLAARVGDAGLRVGVGRGRLDLGEGRVVVVGVGVAAAIPGDERQRLDVQRRVRVLVRVLGADDDRSRAPVGHSRAVVDPEVAGHER